LSDLTYTRIGVQTNEYQNVQTVTHIGMIVRANERQNFERFGKYLDDSTDERISERADRDSYLDVLISERTLDYGNGDSYGYDSTGERISERANPDSYLDVLTSERISERADPDLWSYVRIVIGTLDYADHDSYLDDSTGERTLDYADPDLCSYVRIVIGTLDYADQDRCSYVRIVKRIFVNNVQIFVRTSVLAIDMLYPAGIRT
jgi:hypothetical protein